MRVNWPPTFTEVPDLETPRLRLRRFRLSDLDAVFNLVSDLAVAKWTARIPHPYERKMAEEWFQLMDRLRDEGQSLSLAITLKEGGTLIGAVSFEIESEPGQAEIGYYLGRPFWGHGYMTEAAAAALDHGFGPLGFNLVRADAFRENEASARVLGKLGFVDRGPVKLEAPARGGMVDAIARTLSRDEWAARRIEA